MCYNILIYLSLIMICLQSYENFKSLIDPSVNIVFVTLLFVLNISKLSIKNVMYWEHFIKKKRCKRCKVSHRVI